MCANRTVVLLRLDIRSTTSPVRLRATDGWVYIHETYRSCAENAICVSLQSVRGNVTRLVFIDGITVGEFTLFLINNFFV